MVVVVVSIVVVKVVRKDGTAHLV